MNMHKTLTSVLKQAYFHKEYMMTFKTKACVQNI